MSNTLKKVWLSLIICSCVSIVTFGQINATAPATTSSTSSNSTTANKPATNQPQINARGYLLLDAYSGEILAQNNANQPMPPASLTKLMTMYVISSALKTGKIHLEDMVKISKEAWKTGGSRMFVQVNSMVPVQDLINGIVVVSGNDAAVAMAEYIGGTQDNFVNIMNQAAAQLGMKNTHFEDVNGLPAPNHYTTPHDLALLAQALVVDFPDYYKSWYGQKSFEYNKIKQNNRNQLLWKDPSVDGMKTGHTDAAGYCLVASAERNGMRLISVVMGAPSPKARTDATETLLNWGFRNFSSHQLYAANQPLVTPRVWFGEYPTVPLGLPNGLHVTIPNGQYKNLKAFLTIQPNLQAPIKKGKPYGKIEVALDNQPLFSQDVVALQDNPKGGMMRRLMDRAALMFRDTD